MHKSIFFWLRIMLVAVIVVAVMIEIVTPLIRRMQQWGWGWRAVVGYELTRLNLGLPGSKSGEQVVHHAWQTAMIDGPQALDVVVTATAAGQTRQSLLEVNARGDGLMVARRSVDQSEVEIPFEAEFVVQGASTPTTIMARLVQNTLLLGLVPAEGGLSTAWFELGSGNQLNQLLGSGGEARHWEVGRAQPAQREGRAVFVVPIRSSFISMQLVVDRQTSLPVELFVPLYSQDEALLAVFFEQSALPTVKEVRGEMTVRFEPYEGELVAIGKPSQTFSIDYLSDWYQQHGWLGLPTWREGVSVRLKRPAELLF